MDELVLVIKTLGQNYCVLDTEDLHSQDRGYYAIDDDEKKWIPMDDTFNLDEYRYKINRSMHKPLFAFRNLGDLRPWPNVLYPSLVHIQMFVFKIAAKLMDFDPERAKTASPIIILELLKNFTSMPGYDSLSPEIKAFVALALNADIFIPDAEPWSQRKIFKCVGVTSIQEGAIIDITPSEFITHHEDEAAQERRKKFDDIDFQDIFAALAGEADFLRCPRPQLIVNNCGEAHLERENRNLFTGIVHGMRLEALNNIELTHHDSIDIPDSIARIDRLLREGGIEGNVIPLYKTTIYFQSYMFVNAKTLYATTMLNPLTHMHRFFVNESGRTALDAQRDVLTYQTVDARGVEVSSTVLIDWCVPKKASVPDPAVMNDKRFDFPLKTFTVSITHHGKEVAAKFEHDFAQLLYAMHKSYDIIRTAFWPHLKFSNRKPKIVSPPEAGAYYNKFTKKTDGDADGDDEAGHGQTHAPAEKKTVDQAERPVCVPTNYAGDPRVAIGLARGIADSIQGSADQVYVSSSGKLVRIGPGVDHVDVFSAFYVSGIRDVPVTNRMEDGKSVMPYAKKTKQEVLMCNPVISGILPGHSFVITARAGSDLLSALEIPREKFAVGLAPLCKPQLFDHTIEEATMTFANPDSSLHIAALQHIKQMKIHVFKATMVSRTTGRIEVVYDFPRFSGRPMICTENYAEAMCLLKFYDGDWKYAPIFVAGDVSVADQRGIIVRTSIVQSARTLVLPAEIRLAIEKHHCVRQVRNFDFFSRTVKPVVLTNAHALCNPLAQVFNEDGLVSAFVIGVDMTKFEEVFTFVSSGAKTPFPIGNDYLTLHCTHPQMPMCLPESRDDFLLPAVAARTAPTGASVVLSDGTEIVYLGPSKNYWFVVQRARGGANALVVPPGLNFDVQRPLTVLTALMTWVMLNFLHVLNADNIDTLVRLVGQIGWTAGVEAPEVIVRSRMVPALARESPVAALTQLLAKYFKSPFKITMPMAARLSEFLRIELEWINRHGLGPSNMKYIDGVHDFFPSEDVFMSAESRRMFRPAASGLRTIVLTWKQYEYSVYRTRARQSLASWAPWLDMTGATNSIALTNHTNFVMRLPGGSVAYAIATDSVEEARAISHAIAVQLNHRDAGNISSVFTLPTLLTLSCSADTLLAFNTSKNPPQGSAYRMQIFVSKKK